MWEPHVIIALVAVTVSILGNIISVTIFATTLRGDIKLIDSRVANVEMILSDLKNTDRRLAIVEDRQSALATRQGNIEKDNILIRQDLQTLHQGLNRQGTVLQRFNDGQFSKE
jgi:cell division protein FtsL